MDSEGNLIVDPNLLKEMGNPLLDDSQDRTGFLMNIDGEVIAEKDGSEEDSDE